MNSASLQCIDYEDSVYTTEQKQAEIINFAEKILNILNLENWDLSLVLCSKSVMADLNLQYRNTNGPTDVLSFAQGDWQSESQDLAGDRYVAGDIVLCIEVMEQNADAFGVSYDEELKRLIIHGILHLAGYDHSTNDISEPMLEYQENILRSLPQGWIV